MSESKKIAEYRALLAKAREQKEAEDLATARASRPLDKFPAGESVIKIVRIKRGQRTRNGPCDLLTYHVLGEDGKFPADPEAERTSVIVSCLRVPFGDAGVGNVFVLDNRGKVQRDEITEWDILAIRVES